MSELVIVQINDTHGYLQPHQELFWAGDHARYQPAGGYARIATILQQIRQEKPGQVLIFDCGDTFHGTKETRNVQRQTRRISQKT